MDPQCDEILQGISEHERTTTFTQKTLRGQNNHSMRPSLEIPEEIEVVMNEIVFTNPDDEDMDGTSTDDDDSPTTKEADQGSDNDTGHKGKRKFTQRKKRRGTFLDYSSADPVVKTTETQARTTTFDRQSPVAKSWVAAVTEAITPTTQATTTTRNSSFRTNKDRSGGYLRNDDSPPYGASVGGISNLSPTSQFTAITQAMSQALTVIESKWEAKAAEQERQLASTLAELQAVNAANLVALQKEKDLQILKLQRALESSATAQARALEASNAAQAHHSDQLKDLIMQVLTRIDANSHQNQLDLQHTPLEQSVLEMNCSSIHSCSSVDSLNESMTDQATNMSIMQMSMDTNDHEGEATKQASQSTTTNSLEVTNPSLRTTSMKAMASKAAVLTKARGARLVKFSAVSDPTQQTIQTFLSKTGSPQETETTTKERRQT
jgi:hypothetical protein